MASSVGKSFTSEITWPLVMVGAFGSLGGMCFGWDINYWSGISTMAEFQKDFGVLDKATGTYSIPPSWQSAGSGLPTAGNAIGCLIVGLIGHRLGRVKAFYLSSIIALVGILIQSTSIHSYWQLMVGRTVNAVGLGIVCNIVPNYQSECAPAKIRGSLINTYQFWLLVGAVLAVTCNWGTYQREDQWAYRIVIVLQFIMPIVILVGATFLPESPRWLVGQGRMEDARKSLAFLRKGKSAEAIDAEISLLMSAEEEQERHHKASSFMDCLRGTNLRRTAIATGVQCLQQAQGSGFIMNYSILFLEQVGITDSYKVYVLLIFVNCIASAGAFYIVDRIGRRYLLIVGGLILGICMFVVGAVTGNQSLSAAERNGALAVLFIWQATQSVTWSSCVWITTAEIPTLQLREKTITIATFTGFCVSVIVVFVSPYIQQSPGNLGSKIAYIWACFSIISAIWVLFFLPEVKGRSLEELDELFQKKVSVWKFGSYVTETYGARVLEADEVSMHDEKVGAEVEVKAKSDSDH